MKRQRAKQYIRTVPVDVTTRYAVIFLILMVRFFFIPMSPYNVFRILFLILMLLIDPKHGGTQGLVEGRILYALSIFFLIEPFHDDDPHST